LLTGEFQVSRLVGMMLLGGSLYAVEIPWYFAWIERHFERQGFVNGLKRALTAQAFLILYGLPVTLLSFNVFRDNLPRYSGV